jgi:hypothetical protein
MNSFNHYAYGSVADWVYEEACGIKPKAPAFAEVIIAPKPTDKLDYLSATLYTRQGKIVSTWYHENGKIKYEIETPVKSRIVIDGKEYRALTIEAMGLTANAYYYSSNKGAEIYESGTSGTPAKFYATKIFTQEDLPEGAVIWVNSGWQYRPEGWKYNGKRPDNVKTTYVTADESWWGTHTQKGFNISKTNNASLVGVSADTVYENFKIYIPVDNIIE